MVPRDLASVNDGPAVSAENRPTAEFAVFDTDASVRIGVGILIVLDVTAKLPPSVILVADAVNPAPPVVNDVDETDVNPASVVDVAPSAILVDPTVSELFVRPAFGIPVKLVPTNAGVVVNVGVAPDVSACRTPAAFVTNPVVLAAVWYGTLPVTPPEILVAVDALPVNAPVNDVDVTDVNPASVVLVAPSAILVDPIVNELFVKAPFGIEVRDAPEPLNVPAVIVPEIVTAVGKLNVTAPVAPETATWFDVPDTEVTPVFVTVTLPVAPDTEIPVPETLLRTPVFDITLLEIRIPVPATYVPDPDNCDQTIPVVPTVIVPDVVITHWVPPMVPF